MHTFFLGCLVVGGVVLVLQTLSGFFGVDGDMPGDFADDVDFDADPELGADEGLELLSVRSLSAGAAVFGAAGLTAETVVPPVLAAVIAAVPGFAAMLFSAWATKKVMGLHSSGTLQLARTAGASGTVYLSVPAGSYGTDRTGLVHVDTHGRTVELRAVTREDEPLPAGSEIFVLGTVEGTEVVEVARPSPTLDQVDSP